MNELEVLSIKNTDIDSGLEYLPKSVKKFYCSGNEKPEAKCQALYNLFANNQGEVETDGYGNIKNFSQKLKTYKEIKE
jgi:hypothetical protein